MSAPKLWKFILKVTFGVIEWHIVFNKILANFFVMQGERGQLDDTADTLRLLERKIEEQNDKLKKLQSKQTIVD